MCVSTAVLCGRRMFVTGTYERTLNSKYTLTAISWTDREAGSECLGAGRGDG